MLADHVALDFINSAHGEGDNEQVELLREFRDLVAWGQRVGLVTPAEANKLLLVEKRDPREARAAYRHALEVRATLDRVFRTIAKGRTPTSRHLDEMHEAVSESLAHATLVPSGDSFSWKWANDEPGRVLWLVVDSAIRLLESDALTRVKECRGCNWVFLDSSKNRSRRWCAMKDGCGEQFKMRRYVERRTARRSD